MESVTLPLVKADVSHVPNDKHIEDSILHQGWLCHLNLCTQRVSSSRGIGIIAKDVFCPFKLFQC